MIFDLSVFVCDREVTGVNLLMMMEGMMMMASPQTGSVTHPLTALMMNLIRYKYLLYIYLCVFLFLSTGAVLC